MSETIRTRVFYDVKGSVKKYLRKIGVTDKADEDDLILIELRQCPKILTELDAAGIHVDGEFDAWHLMEMNELGFLIYIAHDGGDGTVFIPFSNVICIHTVDRRQLKHVRNPQRRPGQKKDN